MRLYKPGEYWWVSFPHGGRTRRRSTRCTTRTAALLVAQRWERERADPDHAAAAAATFGGAVTGFLGELGRTDRSAATVKMYRQKCGVLVRLIGADTPLADVTPAVVDKYLADREAEAVAFDDSGEPTRSVSPNTIHKELVALRQVLKRARRRREFRRELDEVLPIGYSPKYVPRKVSLTLEQAPKVLAQLAPHRAAAASFVLATTARRSEVFSARTEDVDIETGRVHLRGTKTAGAERTVTVAPFARPLLAFALERGGGKNGLLFRPWPNARRGLANACRAVGAPRVTWNDLRRTLSTWLIEGGVSDVVVANLLGHADTTMLHRVYGRPSDKAVGALLESQSIGMEAIRVVDVSATDSDQTEPTEAEDDPDEEEGNTDEVAGFPVGRMGLEPMTYGLKGRQPKSKKSSKPAESSAEPPPSRRVVDVSGAGHWLAEAVGALCGMAFAAGHDVGISS